MIEGRILIVDDEKVNRRILREGIEKFGIFEVYEASNGKEALEVLYKINIDIILLDIIMPVMDGFDFLLNWKNEPKFKNIQIIIVSAINDLNSIYKALKFGCYDFITKPLFKDVVEKLLPIKISNVLKYKRNIEHIEKINKDLENEIKKRMQDLIHAERLITIGVLTSAIIHDINSPLTYIKGSIELLEKYLPKLTNYIKNKNLIQDNEKIDNFEYKVLIEKYFDMLSNAKKGIEKIEDIIVTYRSFMKKDKTRFNFYDINNILENAIEITSNYTKYKTEIVKKLEKVPLIYVDRNKLEQVFINLLINAVEAIEDRGKIFIKTYYLDNFVFAEIKDTGKGIPEEVKNKIFDAFYTSKKKSGTGLGLYISKQIINQFNGDIFVESELNKGTKFTIKIPVATNGENLKISELRK